MTGFFKKTEKTITIFSYYSGKILWRKLNRKSPFCYNPKIIIDIEKKEIEIRKPWPWHKNSIKWIIDDIFIDPTEEDGIIIINKSSQQRERIKYLINRDDLISRVEEIKKIQTI